MTASTPLAPNLAPVASLLGTWKGEGAGSYPTIDDFSYTEEITFTDVGKPFLHYVQKTWGPTGAPMHTETGYLRIPGDGTAEFVLAQPTGQTELCEGTVRCDGDGVVLEFHASLVNSASAKQVTSTHRRYDFSGDEVTSTFAMAAVGQAMTHHLRAQLRRA
jgi:hypothetical protein